MRSTNSKQRPWVVIASREGSTPQAIGAFVSQQAAQGWIDLHWDRHPIWAFSTAKLNPVPTAPTPWEPRKSRRLPDQTARGHWWQRRFWRRRREDREQAEREPITEGR